MRKELSEKLRRSYPTLYQRNGSFACGNGWYHIVDVVSRLLEQETPGITAHQVKEKFGSLNFYYGPYRAYTGGVISMAQYVSRITCEECGAPANRYGFSGNVATRCKKHMLSQDYKWIPDIENDEDTEAVDDITKFSAHGLGAGWSRLVMTLEMVIKYHEEHKNLPLVDLTVKKVHDALFVVMDGDDQARGMVDFVNYYAARIDENTGEILK